MLKLRCFLAASLIATAASAMAQTAPAGQTPQAQAPPAPKAPVQPTGTLPLCGGMYQIGPPAKLPPEDLKTVVYQVAACFEKQGGFSVVDPQTYLYYMEVARQVSDPGEGVIKEKTKGKKK